MENIYILILSALKSGDSKGLFTNEVSKIYSRDVNPLIMDFGDVSKGENLKIDDEGVDTFNIIGSTKLNLEAIYESRKKKTNIIFAFALILSSISVCLILYLAIKLYNNPKGIDIVKEWWGIMITVVSGATGGILLKIYNDSNNSCNEIERDIRSLAIYQGVSYCLSNIKDHSLKKLLVEKIDFGLLINRQQ